VQCYIKTVAMESTGVYWIPLHEVLEDRGRVLISGLTSMGCGLQFIEPGKPIQNADIEA
jgi:hypothetical protein